MSCDSNFVPDWQLLILVAVHECSSQIETGTQAAGPTTPFSNVTCYFEIQSKKGFYCIRDGKPIRFELALVP